TLTDPPISIYIASDGEHDANVFVFWNGLIFVLIAIIRFGVFIAVTTLAFAILLSSAKFSASTTSTVTVTSSDSRSRTPGSETAKRTSSLGSTLAVRNGSGAHAVRNNTPIRARMSPIAIAIQGKCRRLSRKRPPIKFTYDW